MKKVQITCGDCGRVSETSREVYFKLKKIGLASCVLCGGNLTWEEIRTGKTDSQKRSRAQEKRAAKRTGGGVQPGSGAGRAKGDVRRAWHSRVECKLTRAKSYSLKLTDLEKIEKETVPPEKPIFEIEFQGVTPHKRYAVIPGWLLDHFMSLEEE